MGEYKQFVENQFRKVKSAASNLISSRNNDKETIELEPHAYEKLTYAADKMKVPVQTLVKHIIDQHLAYSTFGIARITTEKKEESPLLYLDGICKFEN